MPTCELDNIGWRAVPQASSHNETKYGKIYETWISKKGQGCSLPEQKYRKFHYSWIKRGGLSDEEDPYGSSNPGKILIGIERSPMYHEPMENDEYRVYRMYNWYNEPTEDPDWLFIKTFDKEECFLKFHKIGESALPQHPLNPPNPPSSQKPQY